MLKKMVDGVEIICSKEEESQIREFWDFNTKYPEYTDCNQYDGLNHPFICMKRAKELHIININKVIDEKILELSKNIQSAEEDFDEKLKSDLLKKRKMLKEILDHDCSSYQTVEELQNHLEYVKTL